MDPTGNGNLPAPESYWLGLRLEFAQACYRQPRGWVVQVRVSKKGKLTLEIKSIELKHNPISQHIRVKYASKKFNTCRKSSCQEYVDSKHRTVGKRLSIPPAQEKKC